jgi:hypothetical protein
MLEGWLSRHRNRTSFILHMIGIPATVAAIPLAIARQWLWAAGLFVGGYALQFIGHLIEGNQSGEEMLFRRLTGRRCREKDAQRQERRQD